MNTEKENSGTAMNHLKTNNSKKSENRDIVYTPDHISREIVNRYKLTGKILDPCAGDNAFSKYIDGCLRCELKEGTDFFKFNNQVDWIIGNPPYSILNEWLQHSFSISKNIVYLLPIAKVFGSQKRLQMIKKYGGMVEIYAPWTGRSIGFEFGWACGTVHFQKDYRGKTSIIC